MEAKHEERHRYFKRELASVINKYNIDNDCNTPDFVLADFCYYSLQTFNEATDWRERLKHKAGSLVSEVSPQPA